MAEYPIFVRSCRGEMIPFDVPLDATVDDVFTMCKESGIALPGMRLAYQGEKLQPEMSLADAAVCSQSVLELISRYDPILWEVDGSPTKLSEDGRSCWMVGKDIRPTYVCGEEVTQGRHRWAVRCDCEEISQLGVLHDLPAVEGSSETRRACIPLTVGWRSGELRAQCCEVPGLQAGVMIPDVRTHEGNGLRPARWQPTTNLVCSFKSPGLARGGSAEVILDVDAGTVRFELDGEAPGELPPGVPHFTGLVPPLRFYTVFRQPGDGVISCDPDSEEPLPRLFT
eukprot:Hpha_TRINITY_DN12162_c0_g1::TRINITY_DN12162_c0_g1_i2::g.81743::m.81743